MACCVVVRRSVACNLCASQFVDVATAVNTDVIRDVDRTNHFAITEVWKTRKDYEAHLAQSHTKQFREKIQPGLGSPFDERLYHTLP